MNVSSSMVSCVSDSIGGTDALKQQTGVAVLKKALKQDESTAVALINGAVKSAVEPGGIGYNVDVKA
jgi:hypothetical protein